jgi:acetyl esterase/lipase
MPTSDAQAEPDLDPVIRLRLLLLGLTLVCCLWSPSLYAAPNDEGRSELQQDLPFRLVPGIPYVTRDGNSLRANYYIPKGKGPFPGVLMVHGGAWRKGNPWHMHGHAVQLARAGYTVVAIAYRLAPAHRFPAQLEDCADAVRFMRRNAQRYKIDPQRIAGYGYSAGGHLVSLLGACGDENDFEFLTADRPAEQSRLQAVVAGGAPCDFNWIAENSRTLAYWLGDTRKQIPKTYQQASPSHFVSRRDPPMFFFHGETDRLVPASSPQRMSEQLRKLGVRAEVHVIPAAGHGAAAMNPESIFAAVEFLDQVLKSSTAPTQRAKER